MNRHWAVYPRTPNLLVYLSQGITVQCTLCLLHTHTHTHTHTALNRSGTQRTGRGPETAGLHVRRRDLATAGITPDCIQSLYLSLAKTAHYTPNHSTPIHPHDLEMVRRALRTVYVTVLTQWILNSTWDFKRTTIGIVASSEKKSQNGNPYIMLEIIIISISYSFWGLRTNKWQCTRVQVFRLCLVGLDQYQHFCFGTIPASGTSASILNLYLM